MKKIIEKAHVLPVFLVVLYLAGIILGAFVVISYPIYIKQKDFFVTRTQMVAQEHLEGKTDTLNEMLSPNTWILIYDKAGICIRCEQPSNFPSGAEPSFSLDKKLASVLEGKNVYGPILGNETSRIMPDILVVTGAPIVEDGTVFGAVFLLKNLMDMPATIVGYSAFFTVFYWLSVMVMVSNLRKKKKLDELQRNYIANVTHALKTPVASIKALAETLCDEVEPDPNQQKVYYGMILREANRQGHMIRDILELSKLQSNGIDFTKTKFNTAEVFTPVLEKYETLADCMGIHLHVAEHATYLPPLYGNPACVRQVLEILLDNALKFVPEGGDIWVEVSFDRKQAVVCIRDNGIGIAAEALPHIFERFYKYSHDFNESGSGLGLAIAKEIVDGMKEKIWVESKPDEGAAFFFTIRIK